MEWEQILQRINSLEDGEEILKRLAGRETEEAYREVLEAIAKNKGYEEGPVPGSYLFPSVSVGRYGGPF